MCGGGAALPDAAAEQKPKPLLNAAAVHEAAALSMLSCAELCCPLRSARPPSRAQITHFRGQRVAAEIEVWNPSFDVTPHGLIEGIITEVRLWRGGRGWPPVSFPFYWRG